MQKKRCSKCRRLRLVKFFTKNGSKKDGLNHSCASCHREYTRKHYKNNIQYYVGKAKISEDKFDSEIRKLKTVPCMDCKKQYNYWQMDFDHVSGKKEFAIGSTFWSYKSRTAIREEIKKCEVVCANCHRDRTYKRKQYVSDV